MCGSSYIVHIDVPTLSASPLSTGHRRASIHFGLIDITSLTLVTPDRPYAIPYPICDILKSVVINFGSWRWPLRGMHAYWHMEQRRCSVEDGWRRIWIVNSWLKANENPNAINTKHSFFKSRMKIWFICNRSFQWPSAHRLTVRNHPYIICIFVCVNGKRVCANIVLGANNLSHMNKTYKHISCCVGHSEAWEALRAIPLSCLTFFFHLFSSCWMMVFFSWVFFMHIWPFGIRYSSQRHSTTRSIIFRPFVLYLDWCK